MPHIGGVSKPGIPIGQRFGRLVVVELSEARTNSGSRKYLCVCDCGIEKLFSAADLRRGDSKSCGCLKRERQVEGSRTHGSSRTPTYVTWTAMRRRCYNPNYGGFQYYGGRGIKVCERWQNFENFLQDMGERPVGMTIDRKNVNGHYDPANCHWATPIEQSRNRRNVK
jgi:hypothetical protein